MLAILIYMHIDKKVIYKNNRIDQRYVYTVKPALDVIFIKQMYSSCISSRVIVTLSVY